MTAFKPLKSYGIGLALWAAFASVPASAMDFKTVPKSGGYIIMGSGSIVAGDRIRLVTTMDNMPLNLNLVGLIVDSPGGSVIEAERLAATIKADGVSVAVGDNGVCASACFLLFAAAPMKFVTVTARIGVHSVVEGSSETLAAMGYTTALARDAASYGVPSGIIGRMVATPPGNMAWLTPAELVSLGARPLTSVTTQPKQVPQPIVAPNATAPVPETLNAVIAPPPSAPSLTFQQGVSDRQAWEGWVASLDPDARAGAEYWAGQRSLKPPGLCHAFKGPDGPPPINWTNGCLSAQPRLRQLDRRRNSEPDYKAGWNSV